MGYGGGEARLTRSGRALGVANMRGTDQADLLDMLGPSSNGAFGLAGWPRLPTRSMTRV
jgi:hypothetical protein